MNFYYPSLLLALLQCSGTVALRSGGILKTDVTVTISSSKDEFAEFAADESVLINVSLKNNDPHNAVQILDYAVPCDVGDEDNDVATDMHMFNVEGLLDGTKNNNLVLWDGSVPYQGAMIKRAKPTGTEYKLLQPGEEIVCKINLANYYKFDNDSKYKITYEVAREELSGVAETEEDLQLESLKSNTLELMINARDYVPLWDRPNTNLRGRSPDLLESSGITFNQCSSSQQSELTQATGLALDFTKEAIAILDDVGQKTSSDRCPRYVEWFGSYDATNHNEVLTGYRAMLTWLTDANVEYDCVCKLKAPIDNIFGYVYANQPFKMTLCPGFWKAEMTGTNSKMGTIVHEVSHYLRTASTVDDAYGQSNCRALASTNPHTASNNADNHEFFAENTPALACCSNSDVIVDVELLDQWPSEASWTLTNTCTNTVVASLNAGTFKDEGLRKNSVSYCVPPGSYSFTINDSAGDGLCYQGQCGYFSISYGAQVVADKRSGEFGSSDTVTFGDACTAGNPEPVPAPLPAPQVDPTPDSAGNPEPVPAPPVAPMPVPAPLPAPQVDPTPDSAQPAMCFPWELLLTLEIKTSNEPQKNSWTLTNNCSGDVLGSVAAGGLTLKDNTYTRAFCVPHTDLSLVITGPVHFSIMYGPHAIADNTEVSDFTTLTYGFGFGCGRDSEALTEPGKIVAIDRN